MDTKKEMKNSDKETKNLEKEIKNLTTTFEEKNRNLTYIMVIGFLIIGLLIIGLYFKKGDSGETKETTSTQTTETQSDDTTTYDVSKMHEVDVDGALALFDDNETHVLYIGRSNCSVCVRTVPSLNEAQERLNYTTDYLDLYKLMQKYASYGDTYWSELQKEIKPLTDKMTVEATANGTTDAIGNLFYDRGFTPTIVIISKGKAVAGFVGYKSADDIATLVQKYL